jgi:hypothetical protein
MKTSFRVAAAAALWICAEPAAAASTAPNPALAGAVAVVKAYGAGPTSYDVVGSAVRLRIATTSGRAQSVYISSVVLKNEARTVCSVAASRADPSGISEGLLLENQTTLPYGYWMLVPAGADKNYGLDYCVELQTTASVNVIQRVLTTVAQIADAKEQSLTGKDVF